VRNETVTERNSASLPVTEAPVIVGYCGTDVLVLGSRGYGPLSRVLMGSVSSAC
jgi:nucleotide-binding universal stress UspA family protein